MYRSPSEYMRSYRRMFLTRKQTFFHYFFGLTGLIVCLVLTLLMPPDLYLAVAVPVIAAASALYIRHQFRSLRMHEAVSPLSEDDFVRISEALSVSEGWIREYAEPGWRVYTTAFRWYNWGTLIYLVKDGDKVLYNSICDLHLRPSTFSFGKNRSNLNACKKAFQR